MGSQLNENSTYDMPVHIIQGSLSSTETERSKWASTFISAELQFDS